jgi:hypothetical protein
MAIIYDKRKHTSTTLKWEVNPEAFPADRLRRNGDVGTGPSRNACPLYHACSACQAKKPNKNDR